jgi:hypothetical protein
LAVLLAAPTAAGDDLRFNRDILPILSENCFSCHGPDSGTRKADLRLDREEGLFSTRDGGRIVMPGKPNESLLWRRVSSTDQEEVMPPVSSDKQLSTRQKARLGQWILQGALWEAHWSFLPPAQVEPPAVERAGWVRNPIDRFILAKLEEQGLLPAPEADRPTLLRRVTLDLTGLPPTPEEVDALVSDHSPDAYEKVVDRLLASPRYGERMATIWLDAARFADTNGYQVDRDREMHAWREWVIRAFNANKPFDQFTVEQLAGDLLPNSTLEQRIATGFNRNHMINEEGGIIPEEFLAEYCADRVETTATVWLGLTLGCARCHDHKYDPFTQKDFYRLYAFFHNVPESGLGVRAAHVRRNAPPYLELPAPDLEAKLASLERALEDIDGRPTAEGPESAGGVAATPSTKEASEHAALTERATALKKEIDATRLEIPTTLVMEELAEPRLTFVLVRGAYDNKGDRVTAGTPSSLPPMTQALPSNRLGLAGWLVDPSNPLTARVTVNRYWQMLFGAGLVRTSENFGSRGERPSHPELLDWLATEFLRREWDVKRIIRLMVTTATYRQSSKLKDDLLKADPENRWLARGPRYRLPAEMIRDQALAAGGLLVEQIGGPSVKPYHPPGLYELVIATSASAYQQDSSASLYRRSLYTYWKRSVPHPAMILFDAPFRETCTVQRSRTNTPLQALNLMNDPTFVEAARALAGRMIREGGAMPAARVRYGFRLVNARSPRPPELAVLTAGLARMEKDFGDDPAAAADLIAVGETHADTALDPWELAAYTLLASTILNLDETITKE